MDKLTILTILTVAISLTHASGKQPDGFDDEYECMVNDLKQRELLRDDAFPYYERVKSLDCNSFVTSMRDELPVKFANTTYKYELELDDPDRQRLYDESRKLYRKNPTCVHNELRRMMFGDVLMLELVLLTAKHNMTKKEAREILEILEIDIPARMDLSMMLCFPQQMNGLIFDEELRNLKVNESELNQEANYCMKKYIIDHKLVNTTVYPVKLNPHNISTENLKCEEMMNDVQEMIVKMLIEKHVTKEFEIPKNVIKCIRAVIHDKKMIEFVFKLIVLAESDLNDQQKEIERKEYINFMKPFLSDASKCFEYKKKK